MIHADDAKVAQTSQEYNIAAGLYRKAAVIFQDLSEKARDDQYKAKAYRVKSHEFFINAAQCLEDVPGKVGDAAVLYKLVGRWTDAGRCFRLARRYQEAADAYERIPDYPTALDVCYEGKLWEEGERIISSEAFTSHSAHTDAQKLHDSFLRRCANYWNTKNDVPRCTKYLGLMKDPTEARLFCRR